MARSTNLLSIASLLLFFVVVLNNNIARVTVAGRPTPATSTPSKEQTAQGTPENNGGQTHGANNKQAETKPGSKVEGSTNPDEKRQTDCLDHEGTVLIPGVGRYMIGSRPQVPTVGGTFLGDSVPAAVNGQYIPGNDDTFVPNPGYEVPNPFHSP